MMKNNRKNLWKLTCLLALNLALLVLISTVNANAVFLGSSGERVAEIQQILNKKHYFEGSPDGLFDFRTARAVSDFQQKNGLEATGKADRKTLSAIGLDSCYSECFDSYSEILSRCIACESCRSYPEMLETAERIIAETDGALTLGKYAVKNYPGFYDCSVMPTEDMYRAAVNASRRSRIRKN